MVSLRSVVGHMVAPAVVFGESVTVLPVVTICVIISEAVTVRVVVEGVVVVTVVS